MLWFGPLKGTFYLSTASIMCVCVCWTTPGQVFNVLTSAYRHASRSCDAPLTWDANFALKEQTRDGVDGSQMSHVCFTVDPIVAQHPTNKPPPPADTYRNTWLSRGSCFPRFAWITLETTREIKANKGGFHTQDLLPFIVSLTTSPLDPLEPAFPCRP